MNHGILSDFSTTLSPLRAESGMAVMSATLSKRDANSWKLATMSWKYVLAVVDEIHLVHREHQVPHTEKIGNESMALGLFDDAFAGIDQNNGEVSRGGTCDHIARVLDMAGRVGNDEFPAGSGKVAVGHINRDALLTLGAKAVGEERQVYDSIATAA